MGFLSSFLVAGPYDNEGGTGFDTPYPPEDISALGANLEAKAGGDRAETDWREMPGQVSHMGYNHLEALFEPRAGACGFALTSIESTKKGRAVLRVGSGGAFKAFWNGAPALEDPQYRGPDPDRFAAAVEVNKGPNQLLVKVCSDDQSALGFFARLTDEEAVAWPAARTEDLRAALQKVVNPGRPGTKLQSPLLLLVNKALGNPKDWKAGIKAARTTSM